jgi:hypothetical protein
MQARAGLATARRTILDIKTTRDASLAVFGHYRRIIPRMHIRRVRVILRQRTARQRPKPSAYIIAAPRTSPRTIRPTSGRLRRSTCPA